ncbi:MAG: hypothetical protein GY894_06580 [Planctomycetes bacterium]|nr:hypothetical protein [Planctomycetota bacterium]MCP4839010.1 hypothetical protein [Planctomycetota bacterium]
MSGDLQPAIALPGKALFGVAFGAPAAVAVIWLIVCQFGSWGDSALGPGLLAIGVTGVVSGAVVLVLRPWKPRPILLWGGLLVAASTGRIVGTIGVCLLLYFAARLPAGPLLIGALAGLVPVLIGETIIAARRFKREAH